MIQFIDNPCVRFTCTSKEFELIKKAENEKADVSNLYEELEQAKSQLIKYAELIAKQAKRIRELTGEDE